MKSLVIYFVGIFIFVGSYDLSHCLRMQVIPGIPNMGKYNTKYIDDIIAKTRRNRRGGEYVFNIEFTSKVYWTNNNVSMHFIFYEYLHNEYRPSFVEVHYKICDLILRDEFIGHIIRSAGMTVCPLPPGRYHMMNMTFNQEFPSIWPFEKGKAELIGTIEPGGKEFLRGDLILTFKMLKS